MRAVRPTVLGVRQVSVKHLDPAKLFSPTPRDVLSLRTACRNWGVPNFRSWNLLLRALSHSSVSHWAAKHLNSDPVYLTPTQLEFLGDRVLAVAAADSGVPGLLDNRGFALVAKRIGVQTLLRCPYQYESLESALSDAYEAVAGAVYLDGGMAAAKKFVQTTLIANAAHVANENKELGHMHERLVEMIAEHFGDHISVNVEEWAEDCGAVPIRGTRVSLNSRIVREWDWASVRKVVLAEEKAPRWQESREEALSAACASAYAIVGKLPPSVPPVELAEYLLQGKVSLSDAKWLALQPGVRIAESVRSSWAVEKYISRQDVGACLAASVTDDLDPKVSPEDICLAVENGLHDVMERNSVSSNALISQLATLGHALCRLCLAEAAFRAGPNVHKSVLHARAVSNNKHRIQLAKRLGGQRKGRTPALVAKPRGKLMMYVALGLVYRKLGYDAAFAWLDGGRRLLLRA